MPLADLVTHAGTHVRASEPLTIESASAQWAYIVSLPVALDGNEVPVVITAHVSVQEGTVGALVVARDMKSILGRVPPSVGAGHHSLDVVVETANPDARFVLRNTTAGGRPCLFTLTGIEVRRADPGSLSGVSLLQSITNGDTPRIDLSKLRRAIPSPLLPTDIKVRGLVDIVNVAELDRRLDFKTPLEYPVSSLGRPFLDWKMEDDDAPILRYLYRNFRPRRHLEFGTWSGTGACYCLEECGAAVWTINLAEGELVNGAPAYSAPIDDAPEGAIPLERDGGQPVYQTDAGMLIGRRYREAGFGHRVCQIYCDSRAWDVSAYPADFFDSVLIDGGHSADVVVSDTRKALAVTRPGAIVMWHDFCPDPAVFDAFGSVVGVITGLTEHWSEFAPALQDVFWVQPSFLLIGVRK